MLTPEELYLDHARGRRSLVLSGHTHPTPPPPTGRARRKLPHLAGSADTTDTETETDRLTIPLPLTMLVCRQSRSMAMTTTARRAGRVGQEGRIKPVGRRGALARAGIKVDGRLAHLGPALGAGPLGDDAVAHGRTCLPLAANGDTLPEPGGRGGSGEGGKRDDGAMSDVQGSRGATRRNDAASISGGPLTWDRFEYRGDGFTGTCVFLYTPSCQRKPTGPSLSPGIELLVGNYMSAKQTVLAIGFAALPQAQPRNVTRRDTHTLIHPDTALHIHAPGRTHTG